MNDMGLEGEIQTAEDVVQQSIPKHDEATPVATGENTSHSDNPPKTQTEKMPDRSQFQIPGKRRKHRHHGHKRAPKQYDELDEDESSLYQPTYDPWTCFIPGLTSPF